MRLLEVYFFSEVIKYLQCLGYLVLAELVYFDIIQVFYDIIKFQLIRTIMRLSSTNSVILFKF